MQSKVDIALGDLVKVISWYEKEQETERLINDIYFSRYRKQMHHNLKWLTVYKDFKKQLKQYWKITFIHSNDVFRVTEINPKGFPFHCKLSRGNTKDDYFYPTQLLYSVFSL